MTATKERLLHRRRCRTRWKLSALTGWNLVTPPPMVLLHAPGRRAGASLESRSPNTGVWYERAGVIHVHTTHSDGMASFEEVAEEAHRCGLGFMLTADHRTLAPLREGEVGYYGNCLVLAGLELTCAEGYVLGFRLPPHFDPQEGEAAEVLDNIRRAGGLGFLSLICDPRFAWQQLPEQGYVGVEVINMGSQGIRSLNLLNVGRALVGARLSGWTRALALLARRPALELRAWDRLAQVRPIVGIGSVDAHARLKVNRRRIPIPSYQASFHLLRTHVLCEEQPTGNVRDDAEQIYDALEAGRCFFSYHIHGDATGFRFHAVSDTGGAAMGEEIPLGGGVRLVAEHPSVQAIFRLFRNGTVIATVRGHRLDTAVHQPGVYRVEVLRWAGRVGSLCAGIRPWIYSNPIYVRA